MNKAEKLRAHYSAAGLARADADPNPLTQFERWLTQATDAGLIEPNAMVLATAATSAAPSQRSVLLKAFDETGFVFFTNHSSRKAQQMHDNAAVCALFPWYALHRQVIIEGQVQPIDAAQSETYFHSRPREAQLGAWASHQSQTLPSRHALNHRLAQVTTRFTDRVVPLPDFWGGYRIHPHRIEFWQGRTHRLHDRILYTRDPKSPWQITRLSP